MKKHAIFTIRYSLLSASNKSSWRIGRESSFNKYKLKLFEPKRLKLRREAFSKITLPSILGAIKNNKEILSEVHILTSTELPQLEKNFLNKIANENKKVKIFYLNPNNVDMSVGDRDYSSTLSYGDVVASIRIDDDDAINLNYLNLLNKWMSNMIQDEFVLSFPWGYGVKINDKITPVAMGEYKARLIAAGLAYIYVYNKNSYSNIYAIGSHVKIDDKLPVILDGFKYMFLRTFHSNNDSKNSFERYIDASEKQININKVKDLFGINV